MIKKLEKNRHEYCYYRQMLAGAESVLASSLRGIRERRRGPSLRW
jgi:hypothetical protein